MLAKEETSWLSGVFLWNFLLFGGSSFDSAMGLPQDRKTLGVRFFEVFPRLTTHSTKHLKKELWTQALQVVACSRQNICLAPQSVFTRLVTRRFKLQFRDRGE